MFSESRFGPPPPPQQYLLHPSQGNVLRWRLGGGGELLILRNSFEVHKEVHLTFYLDVQRITEKLVDNNQLSFGKPETLR